MSSNDHEDLVASRRTDRNETGLDGRAPSGITGAKVEALTLRIARSLDASLRMLVRQEMRA